MTTNQTPDSTSGQAATARRMIGGVYGHRRWHEERGTCEQKGCTAMTTNQTPEQRALMDVIEGWYSTTNTGSREDIESAVEAYGEARYAAGRRDALETVDSYIQHRDDCGWCRGVKACNCGLDAALATPTETKP